MRHLNYKSKTHPIHEDIKPIVSAFKHGKRGIALKRFQKFCTNRKLMRWESLIIGQLIREACHKQNIAMGSGAVN